MFKTRGRVLRETLICVMIIKQSVDLITIHLSVSRKNGSGLVTFQRKIAHLLDAKRLAGGEGGG